MLVLLVLLSSNREADTRVSVFPVAVTKREEVRQSPRHIASWKAFSQNWLDTHVRNIS